MKSESEIRELKRNLIVVNGAFADAINNATQYDLELIDRVLEWVLENDKG